MKKSTFQYGRDKELRQKAVTMYKQGLPLRQVGVIIGRSHEWVRQALIIEQEVENKVIHNTALTKNDKVVS